MRYFCSLKKTCVLLFIFAFLLFMVACGDNEKDDGPKADPLVPTAISLKVKVAKVQINNEVKLTYTITPATAQNDAVTVSVNNDLGSAVVKGNNTIILTSGSKTGNIKVTLTTSNGLSASKTIKIQESEVLSYPDLSGYTIVIGQSGPTLGDLDIHLGKETEEQYGYYSAADKEFKLQAWDEIEENYNCIFEVRAYPTDAPWGPSRWQYILTQAQNEATEYDFCVVPDGNIPGFVAGNALIDLTDWYAQYGKNLMNDINITASTYKQRLYSINENEINVYCFLGYNIGLLENIQEQDPTIGNPSQMYLDNEWNYTTFKEYCLKVQTALNTMYTEESYYCLSGYGTYYWKGMVDAGGVKVLDTTSLKVNITGATETLAAQTLQELYVAGVMDPSFQVDEGVATWNAGHALFNTGDLWFVNHPMRWSKTLWGEDKTRYGFVPYPAPEGCEHVFIGTTTDACIVMPAGREWAYKGFGEECTTENIYRAYIDYLTTARSYYLSSEDYDKVAALTTIGTSKFSNEESIQAYIKATIGDQQEDGSYVGGLTEYGFYDPFLENSNPVVGNYGGSGTFAGSINEFIKGSGASQWIDAVGSYQSIIEKSLIDAYG